MDGEWNPPLPASIRARLRELVGLVDPDQNDPLHVRLVNTIQRTSTYSLGAQLTAVRFDFNWTQRDAGAKKATLKAEYDRHVNRETTRLLMEAAAKGEKLSRILAEQTVRASDEAYDLQMKQLLAEHEEQSLRKFLDTLDGAIETWRTDRADDRATDHIIARGQGGQA